MIAYTGNIYDNKYGFRIYDRKHGRHNLSDNKFRKQTCIWYETWETCTIENVGKIIYMKAKRETHYDSKHGKHIW